MRKSQLSEAYDKYLWPKCSKMTYLSRVQRWVNIIDALKPVVKKERHPKWTITTKKFQSEMEWYHNQEWPKANRTRYYQRLYQWWTKEDAILLNPPIHKFNKSYIKKDVYVRPKTPIIRRDIPDYYEIRVKYSKEEANVIRREYENMIETLEYKWRDVDDPMEAKNISQKIDKLKNELKIFCIINYQAT